MIKRNLAPVWLGIVILSGMFLLGQEAWPPPSDCVDADGDGYGVGEGCAGPDCDDSDPGCREGACCGLPSTEPTLPPNTARDAEYYYPLSWAACYYNENALPENDDLHLRRIDPATGRFSETDVIVLARDIGDKGAQGPEWARDQNGFYVLFNRQVNGRFEVWRTTPFGPDPQQEPIGLVRVAAIPGEDVTHSMHSRGHDLDRVGVLLRTDRGAQYGFLDEVEQSPDNLKPLPYDKVGDKARWLPGQLRFAYIGRVDAGGRSTRQVVLVDARDDTSQVVSDPAVVRNYTTATPFRAPEYQDEVLIAATAEHEIAIYRDLGGEHWAEIQVLTSPDPELRYLDGVEVIEGDGADSPLVGCMPWQTAYITAWAKDDLVFPTETGVFLWSLDGTYAQRIDTGNETGAAHYDPEIVVTRDASSGQESLFVHFTSRDPGGELRQVNVGQTGLHWPSCAP